MSLPDYVVNGAKVIARKSCLGVGLYYKLPQKGNRIQKKMIAVLAKMNNEITAILHRILKSNLQ
ncbi:MAG: hypothetical protein V1897_12705 [Pseudomonadota bacterium]